VNDKLNDFKLTIFKIQAKKKKNDLGRPPRNWRLNALKLVS
jgi:hypothetical protein